MRKIGLGFLFALLMLSLFAISASANTVPADHNKEAVLPITIPATNPNANGTTDGINTNDGSTFNSVIKSNKMLDNLGNMKDHKTHGSYQNNTNSCASCHQTHTSQARQLLFADSTYNTCTACHDGTLGFYNVFENGKKYFNSETTAGTFGGSHQGNMSVHLATGALKVSAAPGGNKTGTAANSWGGQFTCASCHAPHGSYSDRLLHYNPANMGNVTPEKGGQLAFRVPVVDFADRNKTVTELNAMGLGLDAARNYTFIGVRGTKAQHVLTGDAYKKIKDDDVVIMVYSRTVNATSGAVTTAKTTNPWLYGYTSTASGRDYASRLYTVPANDVYYPNNVALGLLNPPNEATGSPGNLTARGLGTSNFTNPVIDQNDYLNNTDPNAPVYFKYDKGLVFSKNDAGKTLLNNAKSADIGRAYAVTLDLKPVVGAVSDVITKHNVEALWTTNTAAGVSVSNWCTTCHTDYLFASSWNGAVSKHGNFNGQKYYGHTTNSGSYTCLRCHYAHGTDVEIMVDGDGATIHDLQATKGWTLETAKAYMIDKNPSSALKKFTNMSGCWACHNSSKAASLKNTNRDELHPNGMISDPSKKEYPRQLITSKIEDTDSSIIYSGTWSQVSDARFSGGKLSLSSVLGSSAEFTFKGTGFKIYGYKHPTYGIYDVYVNGQKISSVDLYNPTAIYQTLVYENMSLANGTHTVRLVHTGTKNPSATNTRINLDAVEVISYKD